MSGKPKLILHLDVNKTLIMVDKAANKPIGIVCNQIIMQNIYGRIVAEPKCDPNQPVSVELMDKNVSLGYRLEYIHDLIESEDKSEYRLKRKDRVSFEKFVSEVLYPLYRKGETEGVNGDDDEEIRNYNKIAKKRRVEIMEKFLELEIGKRFRVFREKMLKEMKSNEPYSIIPSFYELLDYLKKEEFDFRIVFRTYGTDLDILIKEYNEYCDGVHKHYPGVTWLRNKRVDVNNKSLIGHIFRTDDKDTLFVGTIGPKEIKSYSTEGSIKVLDQPRRIYEFFVKGSSDETITLRDHYHYWNMNGEYGRFGKVFVVDRNDKDVLQVFFDDNMLFSNKTRGIVDLQDVNGEHLDCIENHGLYLHTINPLRAVINRKYFIERLEMSLRNFK